jgi:endonuclease YncB( thermonuclease family)
MTKVIEAPYNYYGVVEAITDGDTIHVMLDKGMKDYSKKIARFLVINADELTDEDPLLRVKAVAAQKYLIQRLPVGCKVYIESKKLDNWGRILGNIYMDGVNIGLEMLEKGLVHKYMTKKQKEAADKKSLLSIKF